MVQWFIERLPFIPSISSFLRQKSVPRHRYSFAYLLGGLSLFFFAVQLVTGVLLALYYSPTPETAHESIVRLVREVEFGWLFRSLHSWGAHCMVAVVIIHMMSTFFMKSYRSPREIMWLTGSILLILVLGFAFTGYLLPWDTIGYYATLIGTEIPRSLPLVGEVVIRILRGGDEIASDTLQRMYVIHVLILPIVTLLLIGVHVTLQQIYGTSRPLGVPESGRPIPFWPNYVYRDIVIWTLGFMILLAFATIFPPSLGQKADPFASAPPGIRPEWYFLPLYQTLRMVPMRVLFFDGEALVNVLVALGFLFWISVPFLHRRAANENTGVFISYIGVILLSYFLGTIALAYLT